MTPRPAAPREGPGRPGDATPARRPAGRRPGDPAETRRAILDAARRAFAASGYERATIRAIAADAGVDPGLVIHHFASKQGLFAAAHELPFNPADALAEIGRLPQAERGEAIARTYLTVFASPGSAAYSLLRAAATNEEAAEMLRGFVHEAVIESAGDVMAGPHPELRLALAASHLVGIAVGRELIGIPELADLDLDSLVQAVAPTIQRYVDGP